MLFLTFNSFSNACELRALWISNMQKKLMFRHFTGLLENKLLYYTLIATFLLKHSYFRVHSDTGILQRRVALTVLQIYCKTT
jgi:hypothetical protein